MTDYPTNDDGDLVVLRQTFGDGNGDDAWSDVNVEIVYRPTEHVYVLSWGDGVVNEWYEEYPTLPLTVARLAALLELQRDGFNRLFAEQANVFAQRTTAWLDNV